MYPPQPGDIYVPKGRKITDKGVDRIYIYLITKHGVFYERLPGGAGGGYCGPGAMGRFLSHWEYSGRSITVAGALKMYRYERHKHWTLRSKIKNLKYLLNDALGVNRDDK